MSEIRTEIPASELIARVRAGFFDPAIRIEQHPMTDDQTQTLLNLIMMPEANAVAAWEEAIEKKVYEALVVARAARRFTRQTDPRVLLFVGLLAKSPGEVVMYLSHAHRVIATRRLEKLDMTNFTAAYAWGFWSKEDLNRLWLGQKAPLEWRGYDNLLDTKAVIDWINAGVE